MSAFFLPICCLSVLFPLLNPTPVEAKSRVQSAIITPIASIATVAAPETVDDGQAGGETFNLPTFSHTGGFYTTTFSLELATTEADASILYTLDGSEPTTDSLHYEGPIVVSSRVGDPNVLSLIVTTIPGYKWNAPSREVFKATIIRARVLGANGEAGPVVTNSYFVDPAGAARYSLPVISVVSDAANFFDPDVGIYVPGNRYDGSLDSPNYAQSGREWERPVHIELFVEGGTRLLAQDAGIRINGNETRRYQSKSLRFYARSDYGPSRFGAQLFSDRPFTDYKTFILRNAGQDWDYAHLRDGVIHRMADHLSLDNQAFRPLILFLNGEYWGILNMRERLDANYLQTHYGIPTDAVDMLELPDEISEGSDAHYRAMIQYIEANGVAAPEHYATIQTQMDMENYIDYNIVEIFSRNTDWPHTNVENWRYQAGVFAPGTAYGFDGRWRWFLNDTDYGFGRDRYQNDIYQLNMLEWATSPEGNGHGAWSTFLLRSLLKNETFRLKFISRFADLLNTTFVPARVLGIVDEVAESLAPEMPEHVRRYQQPASVAAWKSEVNLVREFVQARPDFQRQHLIDYFGLGGLETVRLNVSNPEAGIIAINSLLIDETTIGITGTPYPWQGIYFQDVPVRITASPNVGYRFVGWEGLDPYQFTKEASVELLLTKELNLTARFEPALDWDPVYLPWAGR